MEMPEFLGGILIGIGIWGLIYLIRTSSWYKDKQTRQAHKEKFG